MGFKRGLVIGKFCPLHKGHLFLLKFAQSFVDELWIVIDTLPEQMFNADQRIKWLKTEMPQAKIVHLKNLPQSPSETKYFWKIWNRHLKSKVLCKIDYVFASEQYGFKLAELFKAKFIPVDLPRSNIKISATKIRQNLTKFWNYLAPAVKRDLLLKVAIVGPESTGKTVLSKKLARIFKTNYVPEMARNLISPGQVTFKIKDFSNFARAHLSAFDALKYNSNKLIFLDSELMTTKIFAQELINKSPAWIDDAIHEQEVDLYLISYPDRKFIQDGKRYFKDKAWKIFRLFLKEIKKKGGKYIILKGSFRQREEQAIRAIQKLKMNFAD